LWPLAVELDDVRVDGTDGAPALECRRIMVRPKLLALLGGALAIDQVDLEEPHVRAVVRDGRLANLSARPGNARPKSSRAPFGALSMTEASLDVDVDGVRATAASVDLDIDAEDAERGPAFEVAVRIGGAQIHRQRHGPGGVAEIDDDSLCSAKARLRVEPDTTIVRRLDAVGMVDMDPAPGTAPPCSTDSSDARRIEISLGHARIRPPEGSRTWPDFDGHVGVRLPLGILERITNTPRIEGWTRLDADVRLGGDSPLPEARGTLDAGGIQIDQYAFAQALHSDFSLARGVFESPLTTIELAGGTLRLSDIVFHPLEHGRLDRARLDGNGIDFTTLLRDLGVHPSSWVAWDIRDLHIPRLSGTVFPMKLDGDLNAKTYSFGVFDRPAEHRDRQRLVGFSEAQILARVSVRPQALEFSDVRATLPHSRVAGGFVSIGFRNDLRVEVPELDVDLEDVSPIGSVPIRGMLHAKAHIGGLFNRPTPEGDIRSATGLVISDIAFGDLSAGHVSVDTATAEVSLSGFRAKRRASEYAVPTAELRFGGGSGFVIDAVAASESFGFRDVLSMFGLEDDPRFDGIEANLGMRADVHVGVGSADDACGGGFVTVEAKGRLADIVLFGEHFAQGSADVSFRWFDRLRGIAGAEADVRSLVLEKEKPSSQGQRPVLNGSILGAGSIRRGGDLSANLVVEAIPLSRLTMLGRIASELEGTVSGVAHVTGNLDDVTPGAGFAAHAQLESSPIRIRGVAFPSSRLDVRMTHRFVPPHVHTGRTRCGAPINPPFDKQAYLADEASHGDWTVDGDLLGASVHLSQVNVTRARFPHLTGRAILRGFDLSAAALLLAPAQSTQAAEDAGLHGAMAKVGGALSGDLEIEDLPLSSPAQARLQFRFGPTVLSREGQTLTLKPPEAPLVIADDVLTLPPLEATIDAAGGFRGGFVLSGDIHKIASDPILSIDAKLEPFDLGLLKHILPKIAQASGRVEGSIHIGGRATRPEMSGAFHAAADDFELQGLPSAITDLRVDAHVEANELTATATAKFSGGVIRFEGSMPIQGMDLGSLEGRLSARNVRMTPADGISAAFNADLNVSYDAKIRAAAATLPQVTGDVTLSTLRYTRPITFNLDLASTRAKRTEIDAYDPARDFVALDVRVHSQAPIVIKNNLIEVQLGIDSGTLEVTGTNQRVGLRGVLRALPGGRFHFQANEFEIQQAFVRFDDATRIAPTLDITAITEYRRYNTTDTSAGAGAGAGAGTGPAAASTGSTGDQSLWRITLHAYGDADNVRVDMTSEPALSQEDIVLLLMVGMTRAELDQLQAGGIGESVALNVLGAASGADRAVKQALPIIDDFRFGSAYSTETGKTEPQLTVGKRLTNDLRASVTAGLSEDRELRADIEWRLNNRLSLQGSYDNINDVSSSALGNLGVDLRWRLEFE
jgi:translocation and assembly module TamB